MVNFISRDWLTKALKIGRLILEVIGSAAILYAVLQHFNLVPTFYSEEHKINTITPIARLYPGAKIRLDFNSYKVIADEDIASVKWEIISGAQHFEADGREPTLVLPPMKSGTYNLCAEVSTLDGKKLDGCSSIHVVQDEPVLVKFPKATQVPVTSAKNDAPLLQRAQSKGVEIYSGNGQWIDAQATAGNDNKLTINIPANSSISLINNQVIFRVKGSENNLNDYDSEHVSDSFSKKNNN